MASEETAGHLILRRAFHGNFLFADASGTLALVEISTKTYNVVVKTKNGVAYRSNHWVSPKMVPLAPVPKDNFDVLGTLVRYARLQELFEKNKGRIDLHALMRIFSDTKGKEEFGYSIENHDVSPRGERWGGSVSSEISQPTKLTFWYAYGWASGMKPEEPKVQMYQDRSWGVYIPFYLPVLEEGEYSTVDGRLTPLAVKYLMTHFGISTPTIKLAPILGQE